MGLLFKVKEVDSKFYNERIENFLPEKIIDIHTHVWLSEFQQGHSDAQKRVASWPAKVAKDNSIEDLLETYRIFFPGKSITPLIFTNIIPRQNLDKANSYVAQSAEKYNCPALIFSDPQWDAEVLKQKLSASKFIGVKSYMSHAPAYIPDNEIRIYDYFPPHHLEALNELGLIAMVHISRSGRLKDPVNLAQLVEIEQKYPNLKLIVAHVGRAYCNEDIGNAFEILSETKNMLFDFSANTNADVFRKLIRCVGPDRILFGSDLPITRMRMRRICENGVYVNLVPQDLYGDVSGDKNMREVGEKEAEKLTFFMYEEIDAFRKACELEKLTEKEVRQIFYDNAANIIDSASGIYG